MSVKKLKIYCKQRFVFYWIFTTISKEEFIEKYLLFLKEVMIFSNDMSCNMFAPQASEHGMEFNLEECGMLLERRKPLELEINESIKSIFAMTADGLLSNEILLDSQFTYGEILVTSKGGWNTLGYPLLTLNLTKI